MNAFCSLLLDVSVDITQSRHCNRNVADDKGLLLLAIERSRISIERRAACTELLKYTRLCKPLSMDVLSYTLYDCIFRLTLILDTSGTNYTIIPYLIICTMASESKSATKAYKVL